MNSIVYKSKDLITAKVEPVRNKLSEKKLKSQLKNAQLVPLLTKQQLLMISPKLMLFLSTFCFYLIETTKSKRKNCQLEVFTKINSSWLANQKQMQLDKIKKNQQK